MNDPEDGRNVLKPAVDADSPVQAAAPGSVPDWEGSDRRGTGGLRGNLVAGARLLLFLPAAPSRFEASANQLILLVALSLVANVSAGFAFVGIGGSFDFHALPSAVFGIVLVLLAGHVIGGLLRKPRFGILIPVAVASAALILNIIADSLWLAVDHGWIPMKDGIASMELYYFLLAWWTAAMLVAVARFSGAGVAARALPVLAFAVIVLVPTYLVPAGWLWGAGASETAGTEPQSFAAVEEAVLYAQPELLQAAVERIEMQRPGIVDLYFVGFAPYASQDVFMKEMNSVESLLRDRFDTAGRSITLVNHASLAGKAPIASLTSLRRALKAVGERIDPEEDVVLLHVTSHGSENHEVSAEFWPLQLTQITPGDLRSALDDAGIKSRVVVVSACYSGGFVEALKGPGTLVVTAADATHSSFGCSDDSDYTYFSRAYFEEALRRTRSFADAFGLAKESIRVRELKEGLESSNPQMFMGALLGPRLDVLRQRLDEPGSGS